jgi:hypothetical protein
MNDLAFFTFTILAVWRISSLLAREEGPFDIFGRLRSLLGVRYNEANESFGTNWLSKGVLCIWCNSLWFTPFTSLLYASTFVEWLILTLAMSSLVVLFESTIAKLTD